ncbi:DNA polymerase-3 subunit delta [Parelusimicrobium proximum]|uniref:DNA polymerase III subunit delta n=1 Tax=Parelusimicrobium proximum TaxID=3228953 RepID=UPI003D17B433
MPKADISILDKRLKEADLSPVYFFTGEDVYRKNIYTSKIQKLIDADDFNITKEDASKIDMGEIITMANTAPVFSSQRFILIRNIEKLKKAGKDALIEYILNPLPSTILVLYYNDNKKFKAETALKKAADSCMLVDFAELKDASLSMWIEAKFKEKGMKAGYDAVEMLAEQIGGDLAALEQDIEKIYLYKTPDTSVSVDDVLACVGYSKEENPFALSNAVMSGDRRTAMKLVGTMLSGGEDAIGILNKISYCVLKMVRIRRMLAAGAGQSEIMSGAGLMFWESRLINNARNFPSEPALMRTLNKIIETDVQLKSSTNTDPAVMLRSVLLTLFGK